MADLYSELMAIRAANGDKLTRPAVVDALKPPDHPLHHRLEWDDQVAGHEYRLIQAGELIRSVSLTVEEGDRRVTVNRFVSVVDDDGRNEYRRVEEIAADPELRDLVVAQLQREWRSWYERAQRYEEVLDLLRQDLEGGDIGK